MPGKPHPLVSGARGIRTHVLPTLGMCGLHWKPNHGFRIDEVHTRDLCRQFHFLRACAGLRYLKDPVLQTYNGQKKSYQEPVKHRHLPSGVHAREHLIGRNADSCIHVCGVWRTLMGSESSCRESLEASVLSVEFGLSVVDSVRLYRGEDNKTGLNMASLGSKQWSLKEPEVQFKHTLTSHLQKRIDMTRKTLVSKKSRSARRLARAPH